PDQVIAKLRAYQQLGIESFILSGYPHADECDRFARLVMPQLKAVGRRHFTGETAS
ncbi:MAG: alkanesulfonate monooxygenase, partial [Myxococcota bacterium]